MGNIGIIASNPTHILSEILEADFLNEWRDATLDPNVICVLQNDVYPDNVYRFVIQKDIAVLFIASKTEFINMRDDGAAEQFFESLERICTVIWENEI